jgi:hypothetical protein
MSKRVGGTFWLWPDPKSSHHSRKCQCQPCGTRKPPRTPPKPPQEAYDEALAAYLACGTGNFADAEKALQGVVAAMTPDLSAKWYEREEADRKAEAEDRKAEERAELTARKAARAAAWREVGIALLMFGIIGAVVAAMFGVVACLGWWLHDGSRVNGAAIPPVNAARQRIINRLEQQEGIFIRTLTAAGLTTAPPESQCLALRPGSPLVPPHWTTPITVRFYSPSGSPESEWKITSTAEPIQICDSSDDEYMIFFSKGKQ